MVNEVWWQSELTWLIQEEELRERESVGQMDPTTTTTTSSPLRSEQLDTNLI